jgi:pentatricopeptide repeat protein
MLSTRSGSLWSSLSGAIELFVTKPTKINPKRIPSTLVKRSTSNRHSNFPYLSNVSISVTPSQNSRLYNRIQIRNYSRYSDVTYRQQTTQQTPFIVKIKGFINEKKYPEALAVFEEMTANSVSPDEQTFALLALAIAHMNPKSSMEYLIKINHQYASLTKPNIPYKPGKSILARMAENLQTKVAAPRASSSQSPIRKSLEANFIEEIDVVTQPSLFETHNVELSNIFKVWVENKAPDIFLEFLLNHHVKPRIPDIVLALEQCIKFQKPEEGWKLYEKWKSCSGPQVFHLAVVLNAEQILPDMSKALVDEKTSLSRIQKVNDDMAEANQLPSYQTLSYLLRHWASVGRFNFVFNLFETMLKDPYIEESLRISDYNVVLNQYAMQQQVSEAEAMFDSLRRHPTLKLDAAIYTTMVKVYARVEDTEKAWALVGEMVRNGSDPAIYARYRGVKKAELDIWPNVVTMSILLDMEARVNGPAALIETFESIRTTYHLTPSLNNWGALLEQLAMQKQYISCFDWFIMMMRTQSLRVTLKECCYLTLLDAKNAPFTTEERDAVTGIKWNAHAEAPPLKDDERRKWISTVYRWKEQYLRNNSINPPPQLDLVALHRIREQLTDSTPTPTQQAASNENVQ